MRYNSQVNTLVEEGINYLDRCAIFWQHSQPLYARKYAIRARRNTVFKKANHRFLQKYFEKELTRVDTGTHRGCTPGVKVVLWLDFT